MKLSIAILSAAASAATALHLPVSIFSEEAALQRQFVDTSKGWLNEFLGNNGETIDNLAGSSEVTDNAWDILKGDPKKFSKVCKFSLCHRRLTAYITHSVHNHLREVLSNCNRPH